MKSVVIEKEWENIRESIHLCMISPLHDKSHIRYSSFLACLPLRQIDFNLHSWNRQDKDHLFNCAYVNFYNFYICTLVNSVVNIYRVDKFFSFKKHQGHLLTLTITFLV